MVPNGKSIYRCYLQRPCESAVTVTFVVDMHGLRFMFFCFLFFQTASSFPPIAENYERAPRLGYRQDSCSVISQSEHHGTPQTMVVARSSKRNDDEDDDLRIRNINILTTTVPLIAAMHDLDMFYNSILYNALAPWINMPPQTALSITCGCLQLKISVVVNYGPPRGIPWAFVRNFARNMLVMTHGGFAGTYDMYYSSIRGAFRPEFSVQVSLRVCWKNVGWNPLP